jgi:hypothetical protein
VAEEEDVSSVHLAVLEGEEGQGSRRVGSVPVRSAVSNGAAGDHYAACIYNTRIGMLNRQ